MSDPLTIAAFAALVVLVVLAVVILLRLGALSRVREDELRGAVRDAADLRAKLDALNAQVAHVERDIRQDLANTRAEQSTAATGLRTEVAEAIGRFRAMTQQQLTDTAGLQQRQLQGFGEQLTRLTLSNEQRLEGVRVTVEQRLDALRNDNTAKLEQMRATVDEKLQTTLNQRLGESFKIVSERLEQVHRGLGEMQTLATGVGDLKRVLANVKTRGMWGEVQLAALLAEVLTPQQYATNVETVPGSDRRVEFAIRLPGRGEEGIPCWLPVDAKFPLEEWQKRPLAGRGQEDSCRVRRAAVHDGLRDSVRADRGTLCGNDGATGIRRSLATRLSCHADRSDQLSRVAQQPADGLSYPRDREAFERSLECPGRCQDGVREVRRRDRESEGENRPGKPYARRYRRAQPRDHATAA